METADYGNVSVHSGKAGSRNGSLEPYKSYTNRDLGSNHTPVHKNVSRFGIHEKSC